MRMQLPIFFVIFQSYKIQNNRIFMKKFEFQIYHVLLRSQTSVEMQIKLYDFSDRIFNFNPIRAHKTFILFKFNLRCEYLNHSVLFLFQGYYNN